MLDGSGSNDLSGENGKVDLFFLEWGDVFNKK